MTVWAVWKGLSIVYRQLVSVAQWKELICTFTYSSQTSMKNDFIPSSFFASCRIRNLVSVYTINEGFM